MDENEYRDVVEALRDLADALERLPRGTQPYPVPYLYPVPYPYPNPYVPGPSWPIITYTYTSAATNEAHT